MDAFFVSVEELLNHSRKAGKTKWHILADVPLGRKNDALLDSKIQLV
jgi:hypothetical protein